MGFHQIGVPFDSAAMAADRFGQRPRLLQGQTEAGEGLGVVRFDVDRPAVAGDGVVDLTERRFGVAKVAQRRRHPRLDFEGGTEVFGGGRRLALLQQRFAQVDQGIHHPGLDGQRLAVAGDGVGAAAAAGEQVATVEMGLGEVGSEGDRLFIGGQGLVAGAGFGEGASQADQRFGVFGVGAGGGGERIGRHAGAAGPAQGGAEIEVGVGEAGVQHHRLAIVEDGVVQAFVFLEGVGEIVVRVGHSGRQGDGALVGREGVVNSPAAAEGAAEQVEQVRRAGRRGHRFLQGPDCFFGASALQRDQRQQAQHVRDVGVLALDREQAFFGLGQPAMLVMADGFGEGPLRGWGRLGGTGAGRHQALSSSSFSLGFADHDRRFPWFGDRRTLAARQGPVQPSPASGPRASSSAPRCSS